MKKDKIIAIVGAVMFIVVELFLMKVGSLLWGAEKAYHICGTFNVALCVIAVVGTSISNIVRRNRNKEEAKISKTGRKAKISVNNTAQ